MATQTVRTKKIIKWSVILIGLIALVIIYKFFNPLESPFFPKCPVKVLTGLDCPGCGSQRAIHHLLNWDLKGALRENALMVLAIPYIILGFAFDMVKNPGEKYIKWRSILFGSTAIYILLGIIALHTILRNIF